MRGGDRRERRNLEFRYTFGSERGQEVVLARGKSRLDVWVSSFSAVVVVIVSMAESV